MKKTGLLLLFAILLSLSPLRADEGMWLLPLIEKLNIKKMSEMGLKLTAKEIYDINNTSLKDAIVHFGGGCTGEIISGEGLLLTNHHCGYGVIQRLSSVDNDYLQHGFWAMSREQELPSPGLSVTFLESFTEVTKEIEKAAKKSKTADEKQKAIADAISEITKKAVGDNKFLAARVTTMYGGNSYYLVVTKTFNDVRFVGAPPSSIGKFGADTDNWMWPRHTGDFAIFRVYADKDNNPAQYSADNKPYIPKKHLTISIKGVEKGDFAMILGYPGRTSRFMTSSEVKETSEITNAISIYVRGIRQDVLMNDMVADPKIRLQYSSKYAGSSNFWKKAIGMNETFAKLNVQERRAQEEKSFAEWVNKDKKRVEKYGKALEGINTAVAARAETLYLLRYLQEALGNIELTAVANHYAPVADAFAKGDKDAAVKAAKALEARIVNFFVNYSEPTDRKVAKALIKVYKDKVKEGHRPSFFATIESKFGGDIDAFVDDLFSNSVFTSKASIDNAINGNPDALINDPALAVGRSIFELMPKLNAQLAKANATYADGHKAYIAGQLEMKKGQAMYPDANSTMRLTYGQVMDYSPKDAVIYDYITTLNGVMEKEDPNNWEFVVPERLKELHKARDYGQYAMANGELPVAFISNNDITGGNSGSPVLNAKGELIGCAFDGNWEAMSGDIIFEPTLQRCINVDVRYILFIIEKYGNAKHLIDEMTIAK
ncbi:MAG: S46 family peptidase [Bacteroidales bacterium]|nr:S46 family peptidase [Bacteroidales bacterium]